MAHARAQQAISEAVPARRRFTIVEYHQMAEAGILGEREPIELLDGDIVRMSPIGLRHMAIVDRLTMLLTRRLGRRVIVRVQGPIVLDDHSEPQPDVALLAPRANFYDHAHPRPPDVFLVIEVMQTSRSYDRTVKLPLYARQHVREAWLVDLKAGAVDVYRRPSASGYREHQRVVRGNRIAPLAFPRVFFRVADILG